VRHLHPSSLILLAAAVLLALASREGVSLYFACSALALAALILAASGLRLLVRRSRWLLLTMLVMFGWFTPGTPLPGIPGASQEGLLLAADYIARLLVALATLALLLKALTPAKLVAGLRSLLAASSLPGPWRDRIAVRLALTLQEVEASRIGQREEPAGLASSISLPAFGFGATDYILGALSGALVLGALLT
jgi:energy-coupling factor transporter transmembrane protein EcfT